MPQHIFIWIALDIKRNSRGKFVLWKAISFESDWRIQTFCKIRFQVFYCNSIMWTFGSRTTSNDRSEIQFYNLREYGILTGVTEVSFELACFQICVNNVDGRF